MSWWSSNRELASEPKTSVPKGLFEKCGNCAAAISVGQLLESLWVCGDCGHHLRLPTLARIESIVDEGTFVEHDESLRSEDPLEFVAAGKTYVQSLQKQWNKKGPESAYISGAADIEGIATEVGFFVFEFMGGSMGSVVGEKITRQFERSLKERRPAVVFCASGGARMQEGVLSLMQMAKTSAARSRLREACIPYIAVLLHPTTGGVAASIAMLGDVIIAEPNALIGFAGPRVIEQTIGEKLPAGFQRSEYLVEHGMLDQIVERHELKSRIARYLRWFSDGQV